MLVGLRHAEASHVQPAAVIKVELLILLNDGCRVQASSETQPTLRQTADHAGLGGQSNKFEYVLFGGDGGETLGHTNPEIDDAANRDLEGAAPSYDLSLAHCHRLDSVEWHTLTPGESMVVVDRVGLPMVRWVGHNDAVDHDAGNLYVAGIERIIGGNSFDLCNHKTAGVAGGGGEAEPVERQRLPLHCDVTVGIGGGAAKQSDVNRKALVEEPGLTSDLVQLDQILGGDVIELSAAETRVDKGSQSNFREIARPMRRDVSIKVADRAKRQVVGLKLVGKRHLCKARNKRVVAADHATEQPVEGKAVDP